MKKLLIIPVLLLLAVLLAPAQNWNLAIPSTTRWVNAAAAGTQAGTSLSAANQTRLFGFTLNAPVTFTNIVFNVATADTAAGSLCGAFADCYSVGIYNATTTFEGWQSTGGVPSAGTLIAHCAATAFNTTGVLDCTTVEGSLTIQPGEYYFAFTGNATTAAITYAAGGISFASNALPSAGGTTTNGALNSSITVPADSWIVASSKQLVFALHD